MNTTLPTVAVGDGVTEYVGSDRYAGTVTWVSKSGKQFRFTQDHAKLVDGSAMSENQTYEYTSVPEMHLGSVLQGSNATTARWVEKRGQFLAHGRAVTVGSRSTYRDPSF